MRSLRRLHGIAAACAAPAHNGLRWGERATLFLTRAITTSPMVDLSQVTNPSAAEAAKYLFASKQHHQRLLAADNAAECRKLEGEVWRVLQQLRDTDIEEAATKDACELLVVWNYFGRFWDMGMEGPSSESPRAAAGDGSSTPDTSLKTSSSRDDGEAGMESGSDGMPRQEAAVEVPLVTREDMDRERQANARKDVMAPARRSNPLDEVLDF